MENHSKAEQLIAGAIAGVITIHALRQALEESFEVVQIRASLEETIEGLDMTAIEMLHEIRVCGLVGEIFQAYDAFEATGGRIGMHRDGNLYAMKDGEDVTDDEFIMCDSIDDPILNEFQRMGGRISIKQSGRPHLEAGTFGIGPRHLEMHATRAHPCVIGSTPLEEALAWEALRDLEC